ncbi:MAG: hypothetical protein IT372_05120 [Polyangiaceae bacterium]|nr:hypothetical protein [Polyangiaceae bacterium]
MRARRLLAAATRLAAAAVLALSLGACGAAPPPTPADPLRALRDEAAASRDGEVVGRWLLGELLVPGGKPAAAKAARKRLDQIAARSRSDARGSGSPDGALRPEPLFASLARAVDDEAHGRFQSAALAYVDAVAAARQSRHPDAPLVAWLSASHLLGLRHSVAGLWQKVRNVVVQSIDHPGNIGWRARGELVEWWTLDGMDDEMAAAGHKASRLDVAAKRFGCIDKARMAGPFGHLAQSDHRVHFEAERAGPWPPVFPRDPLRMQPPRVLEVERRGCQLSPAGPTEGGVYYVETFVELPADRELIVAVQGAFAVLVDDVEVLTRDTKQWGIWPRFGARLRLAAGRHRILARVGGRDTSIRLLAPDGTPLGAATSDDPAPPYAITPPERLPDPNPIEPFLTALGVPPQPGTPRPPAPRDVSDPISRYLAAYVAHLEGQEDVSSVLIEPLVKDPATATGPALAAQAVFIEKDPIFPESDARDLVKDVRARAAQKDPALWWPRFWLALDEADKIGVPEVARKIEALAGEFREVPDILTALASMYARLGWKAEHAATVKEAAARFPDDADVLGAMRGLLVEDGKTAEADALAARIRRLDPDSEIELERAIDRRDYAAAIAELERLGSLRKDRKDIAIRIADLLTRAGKGEESLEKLERALAKDPDDAAARLALADARLARGDRDALQKALIEAIRRGSDAGDLRDAIELIDCTTELSPYREDGARVIAQYEASGQTMPGNAARVLDYAALWVHGNGSARMLEHEIIRIQSREAIQEHAEQRVPRGLVLKLRTVKRDGAILEPEVVEGKPTVTMPHLEVGDYIETESIWSLRSDGRGGRTFEGPRWMFREEKVPYWRSELVVISPKNRALDVEIGGEVPPAQVTEAGAVAVRRWRVDKSPALPEEPGSAPLSEFIPNVRIGWGINLQDTLARMVDAAADETPRDPRLIRVARAIALGDDAKRRGPPPSLDEQARRVYRWVLANVEPGRETDGRRAVIGKSGNRTEAFVHLCRLLGIDASYGVVRDRLTAPPRGPMSEAESFNALAVRVDARGPGSPRWMVVREKFAPYGYLPSSLRGQPAVVLRPGAPREVTTSAGAVDGVTHEGVAELAADGSATLELRQSFEGKLAIGLRTALETLPDARLKETIEAKLLPQALPGARLDALEVENLTNLDAPLVLVMKVRTASFARSREGELVISPPFMVHLGNLAGLPARETPLYISEQIATRSAVRVRVKLPQGARVATALAPISAEDSGRTVQVSDRVDKGELVFERVVDLPAGRVQPEAYRAFQQFARSADAALGRDVVIALDGR